MVQLGLKERVLSSSTIWICATCEACATRCPNEVEIVKVMDALREIASRERVEGKELGIQVAHHTFLSVVKHLGRQHEVSLVALLKMKSRNFFEDMVLGAKLFLKGKLRLKPYRIRGVREIKEIYRGCGL
jgi:heterodisulfide reductase subunit C